MSAVSPQWAYSLVKDGKLLYDAEKLKRESFGKLFREDSSLFHICFFPGSLAHPVSFLPGKSFLRNRLFKGLDSWPPRAFCVSCCSVNVPPPPHCALRASSSVFYWMFADAEAQEVRRRASGHLRGGPAVPEVVLSCGGAAVPNVRPRPSPSPRASAVIGLTVTSVISHQSSLNTDVTESAVMRGSATRGRSFPVYV